MTEPVSTEKEIRAEFHDIMNVLNRITVETGKILYMDRFENLASIPRETLDKEIEKTVAAVAVIEKTTIEAGQRINELKLKLYRALGYK